MQFHVRIQRERKGNTRKGNISPFDEKMEKLMIKESISLFTQLKKISSWFQITPSVFTLGQTEKHWVVIPWSS